MSITTTELIKGIPDWNQTINENNAILANAIDDNVNKIGVLNESLSEIPSQYVAKVTGKGLSTNDYDNIEKAKVALITNKADTTYVDTKIASVASGAPDETFTTLANLNTAYPTGDSKNKLVSEDGHIYYWNGSTWADTGIQYQSTGIADGSIGFTQTDFLELDTNLNLFNGKYTSKRITGTPMTCVLDNGTVGINQTAIINIKPNTTYSIIKGTSDIFKIATDTILNRPIQQTLLGSIQWTSSAPTTELCKTFTTGASDIVLYVYASYSGQNPFMQIVEGTQTAFSISEYPINPKGINIYNKSECNELFVKKSEMNTRELVVKKTGNIINIYVPSPYCDKYTLYLYKKYIDATINYDSWRIYNIGICDSNLNLLYYLGSQIECEGAIKENGKNDFVCGFHGDEYNTYLDVIIDGVIMDKSLDWDIKCAKVEITNKSYVNHCDTTTKVFDRFRINTFTVDGMSVKNKFNVVDNIYIDECPLCLLAVNKKVNNSAIITKCKDNASMELIDVPYNTEMTAFNGSTYFTRGEIFGDIYVSAEMTEYEDTANNAYGNFTDFIDRIKIYVYCNKNHQFSIGDMIKCNSNIKVFAVK